jgi:ribosomal-protein-alanine N-acetyltransferase
MADFVNKNKSHLLPWEPLQSNEYYTVNHWQEKIKEIHQDFLGDKSCCLNLYSKYDEKLIGMVNFSNFVRGAFHSCFLGFKIAADMQNKGLMTESLKASIQYVFNNLNLHRISANYMPRNAASGRVLAKCGFRQEGIAEDYLRINGKWEQHVLTSLINHDWKKS